MAKQRKANTVRMRLEYDEEMEKYVLLCRASYEDSTGAMRDYSCDWCKVDTSEAEDADIAAFAALAAAECDSKEGI